MDFPKTCQICGAKLPGGEFVTIDITNHRHIKAWNASMPQWKKCTILCMECYEKMICNIPLIDVYERR